MIKTPPLIESVPNFSEGRDLRLLEKLAVTMDKISGVGLLDYSSDYDHNRSVYTLAGKPESITEALFNGFVFALEHFDLNTHRGAHPRIGAVDVTPFIPVAGADLEYCGIVARNFGENVAKELQLPVYLYGQAALISGRDNLSELRRGNFEGLSAKLQTQEWRPDFGRRHPHPTFGAAVIGSRFFLIAINFNLNRYDMEAARAIAKAIRFSSNGMAEVKSIAVDLHSRGIAQVSCNLLDYRITSPVQVFERVSQLAAAYNTAVAETEIIGLPPQASLAGCDWQLMRMTNFSPRQILESQLVEHGLLMKE